MNATGVTAGPAESNGRLLLSKWRDSFHVTCGLTACTPGSAPGPTLGNEYGKTLPFFYLEESIHAISQCMDVTLVELICKAGHRGARLLASDELMLRRQNARVTVPQSSILRA